ncbi:MAG: hypothetical protein GVY04_18880 [Cyanobacteria bacterium]|jgi:glutamate/tyrosine decarboxylase-like PLP-dependent enzyme|nr:hypothetical protein [Cyanobacteria bacterium GSL.Bin1]
MKKVFGTEAFGRAVQQGLELARYAEHRIHSLENWKIVTKAQMGIVTFRYEAEGYSDGDLNQLNQSLVAALIQDGTAMISSTKLRGKTVLRICPINPRTTPDDIDLTISRLQELIETVKQSLI